MDKRKVNKWLIMALATLVSMLDFGLVFSFGAMFVAMLDKFQTDRSTTAVVQSLLVGVTLCFGVVSGALIARFGLPVITLASSILVSVGLGASFFAPRIEFLYISIGVVTGTGISMAYISAVTVIGRVFTRNQKLLCLTVLTFGSGVAGVCYPYLLEWLVSLYGLNGTFLILGALTANNMAFSVICWLSADRIEIKADVKLEPVDKITKLNNGKFQALFTWKQTILDAKSYARSLLTKSYILVLVACGTSIAALSGYFSFILDIAKWKGLHDAQGLVVFACYSTSNALSRLLPALCNREDSLALFVFPISVTLSGVVGHIMIYFSKHFATFAAASALNGIAVGGIVSGSVLLVVRIVKPDQLPVATGLLFTVFGLLTVSIGPVFGWVRDTSDSYGIVLIIICAAQVLATALFVLTLLFQHRHLRSTKTASEQKTVSIFVTKL